MLARNILEKAQIEKYKFWHKLAELGYVENIYLYGSRARGDFVAKSDIDIAIDCPNATNLEWQKIMEIIENADTLLGIDCIRLQNADENLLNNINRDKKIIYQNE